MLLTRGYKVIFFFNIPLILNLLNRYRLKFSSSVKGIEQLPTSFDFETAFQEQPFTVPNLDRVCP